MIVVSSSFLLCSSAGSSLWWFIGDVLHGSCVVGLVTVWLVMGFLPSTSCSTSGRLGSVVGLVTVSSSIIVGSMIVPLHPIRSVSMLVGLSSSLVRSMQIGSEAFDGLDLAWVQGMGAICRGMNVLPPL